MKIVINSRENHDVLMNAMDALRDTTKPKLGIFWFNKDDFKLFGVHKSDIDTIKSHNDIKIYGKLHYQVWKSEYFSKLGKGDPEYKLFKGDYVNVPRGRVNFEKDRYRIYVGSWINDLGDKQDNFLNLVKSEFNLPDDDLEVVIDEHWDLGHGFSGDKFTD